MLSSNIVRVPSEARSYVIERFERHPSGGGAVRFFNPGHLQREWLDRKGDWRPVPKGAAVPPQYEVRSPGNADRWVDFSHDVAFPVDTESLIDAWHVIENDASEPHRFQYRVRAWQEVANQLGYGPLAQNRWRAMAEAARAGDAAASTDLGALATLADREGRAIAFTKDMVDHLDQIDGEPAVVYSLITGRAAVTSVSDEGWITLEDGGADPFDLAAAVNHSVGL